MQFQILKEALHTAIISLLRGFFRTQQQKNTRKCTRPFNSENLRLLPTKCMSVHLIIFTKK